MTVKNALWSGSEDRQDQSGNVFFELQVLYLLILSVTGCKMFFLWLCTYNFPSLVGALNPAALSLKVPAGLQHLRRFAPQWNTFLVQCRTSLLTCSPWLIEQSCNNKNYWNSISCVTTFLFSILAAKHGFVVALWSRRLSGWLVRKIQSWSRIPS